LSGVNEAASQQGGQFQANLFAGMQLLSGAQEIAFTQYTRYVLPLDGYVFWRAVQQTRITGVLHYDAREQQNHDESFTINRVVFTTTEKIREFAGVDPNTLWIGEAMGLRFTFSEQGMFFQQSGLYHYRGDAVYPALETQLVDLGSEYPTTTLIVSNSLPWWLSLKYYNPPWLVAGNPGITLYPAFLVPDNLRPPYGAIAIPEDRTAPMAGIPVIGQMGQHWQLASDEVHVTLYGLTNAQAAAFLDLVNQYSVDQDIVGMMSISVIRDAHRTQTELSVLAMKKTFRFEVNYLQQAMPDVALKLITSAPVIIYPQTEI
jgi:hypothetical protein